MAYQISIKNEVLQIALTGRLTANDLEGMALEAKKYESDAVVPHRITDMTGITEMDVYYPAVMMLAEQRRQLRFPNSFKSAIIASQPQHIGYARMFQTLNNNPQITIRIFPDATSASEWIAGVNQPDERNLTQPTVAA